MAVMVILRVPGSPDDLERYAAGPGGEVMQRISAAAKAAGAIRHTFAGGEGEVVVIDEWPDEESFQNFFASQGEIPDVMRNAGAQGPPVTTVYRKLNTFDQF